MPKWIDRIAGIFERKASAAASTIVATSVGSAIWTPRSYLELADEAYVRNAIANRCIQMIAQAAAYIPILLVDANGKEVESHALIDLLRRPAPNATGSELIESLFTYLKLSGNAYLEAVGPKRSGAVPLELYSHRPDRIRIIAGRSALPMAYVYNANGFETRWDVDQISGKSPILHLRQFNPTNDWYGLASTEAAAYSIDQHNESSKHNMAILQNGAAPSGALMFKPVASEGKLLMPPQQVIAAAESRMEEMHQGARNSGRPMVFGGNVDWVQFGQTLQELQLNESKLEAAREICTAYGVPHTLLIPGQSTYNNNREAKLALYEETILPQFDWLLDHLNIWLTPQFIEGGKLVADKDDIDALSVRRDENRRTMVDLFEKKIVTRNDVRESLDYDPIEDRPDFDPNQFEINAITSLMSSGKLSKQTGWKVLQGWGILPADFDAADELERLEEEMPATDGMLGVDDPFESVAPNKVPSTKPTPKVN